MSKSVSIAIEVFGMGFAISFFIAVLIKAMLFTIRRFTGKYANKT